MSDKIESKHDINLAYYGEEKVAELMENPDIIRNRRKIEGAIKMRRYT